MGRGGRGGGSHHSHHSSHRSSRGHSSHSSRSYRSSSHSSYHGSHYHHHHHHHHGYYGGGYYGGGYYRRRSNPFSVLISLMIFGFLMLIVFINVILSGFSSTEKGITKSTKDRTALSANLCTDIGSYYYDDLDWIYDSSTLVNGMRYFYQTTGVQPFLYITDNIAGDYSGNYSISVQNDYGDQIYDSLFNDEGHILVIFCEYRDSEYVCFTTAGADATSVMDSEAREILLDYIDNYYYSDYEDEEYFARAFRQSADRIMNKTSAGGNTRITLNLMPFIVIFIVLIIVIVNIIKDRKRKAQQMAANGGYGNNGTYGANGANDYYDLTAQSQPTQNQYGQTQYGQNQYGQTQYGQNQYGQTQYDQTQPPYQSSYNGNNYNNNNNNGF